MTDLKLDLVKVQDAIYTWIKKETEGVIPAEQILWRDGSEPLPPRPCVTMKITGAPKRVGLQDNLVYQQGSRFNIGGQREMTVSIQIFGNLEMHKPLAMQVALDLNSSLSKLTTLDGLRASRIAVQKQGEPTNLTALEETEYEERWGFDVQFGVAQNIVDDPGIIESVNADGTVGTKDVPVVADSTP